MHPEPELRVAAHVHLQHVRTPLGQRLDRIGALRVRHVNRRLVDHPVAPARQREREDGNHRHTGAQRQRRNGRRRDGRPVEELDGDRAPILHVLVDHHPDRPVLEQRPEQTTHRALAGNDAGADTGAHTLDHRLEERVVEGARDHQDRPEPGRMHHDLQLPEPEVTGVEHHPPPRRQRLLDPLRPLELHQIHHLLRAHRVEPQQVEHVTPEVREGAANNRPALVVGAHRECGPDVGHGDLPSPPVHTIEQRAQPGTRRHQPPPRHRTHQQPDGQHRQILQSMADRPVSPDRHDGSLRQRRHAAEALSAASRSARNARNWSAGSTPRVSGTVASGGSNGSHACKRTPSFSVVRIACARAVRAAA